jgi:hypothetical protein
MDSSAPSKLTAFQREVLDAFFQRERGFFLTGGAALAGFHLGHRTTEDLTCSRCNKRRSSAVASSLGRSLPRSVRSCAFVRMLLGSDASS